MGIRFLRVNRGGGGVTPADRDIFGDLRDPQGHEPGKGGQLLGPGTRGAGCKAPLGRTGPGQGEEPYTPEAAWDPFLQSVNQGAQRRAGAWLAGVGWQEPRPLGGPRSGHWVRRWSGRGQGCGPRALMAAPVSAGALTEAPQFKKESLRGASGTPARGPHCSLWKFPWTAVALLLAHSLKWAPLGPSSLGIWDVGRLS